MRRFILMFTGLVLLAGSAQAEIRQMEMTIFGMD